MKNLREFRLLFECHYTPLVSTSYGITKNKEQSKDIVQNFFVYIWQSASLDKIQNFEAFAYSSVRNKSLNFLRDDKKFARELPELAIHDREINSHPDYARYLLAAAIRQLPKKCKEIFLLTKEEGLTYEEVAQTLNLSIKTVERQMSIGLKKLRESLTPHKEVFLNNERL